MLSLAFRLVCCILTVNIDIKSNGLKLLFVVCYAVLRNHLTPNDKFLRRLVCLIRKIDDSVCKYRLCLFVNRSLLIKIPSSFHHTGMYKKNRDYDDSDCAAGHNMCCCWTWLQDTRTLLKRNRVLKNAELYLRWQSLCWIKTYLHTNVSVSSTRNQAIITHHACKKWTSYIFTLNRSVVKLN